MIVKTKAFADRRAYIGSVGRAGENAVRALEIDCAEVLAEYPDAEIIAVVRRAQGDPYTVALEKDGAVRRLVFLEADYKYPGRLEIELRAIDGEKILKSAIYAATVEESIQGESDTPGQPVRDVLDRLETEIAAAQAVVDDIKAKLDSGAFKGEKGDKGDPGEPGSGATVVPATNAQIDTHTDAAHVLAPSNMDYAVKAAMTDGKGAAWTAAEQQAARDRMGLDKSYELIEEIVLEEEVSFLERELEPNGAAYHFIKMFVNIETPQNAKNGSVYSYFNDIIFGLSPSAIQSQYAEGGIGQIYAYVVEGLLDGYGIGAPNVGSSSNLIRYVVPENRPSAVQAMNKMTLRSTTNLPINTKIRIYGVRA